MVTKVPYTAVLRDPTAGYSVHHLNLSSGMSLARKELESSLGGEMELAALVQGNMPISIPEEKWTR